MEICNILNSFNKNIWLTFCVDTCTKTTIKTFNWIKQRKRCVMFIQRPVQNLPDLVMIISVRPSWLNPCQSACVSRWHRTCRRAQLANDNVRESSDRLISSSSVSIKQWPTIILTNEEKNYRLDQSLNSDSLAYITWRRRSAPCKNLQTRVSNKNKKLGWCWQTRATRLEVSQGHQTRYHSIC